MSWLSEVVAGLVGVSFGVAGAVPVSILIWLLMGRPGKVRGWTNEV